MFITSDGNPINPVVAVNEEGRRIIRIDQQFAGEVWIYLMEGLLEGCRVVAQNSINGVRNIAENCLNLPSGAESPYYVQWVKIGDDAPREDYGDYPDAKATDGVILGWLENGQVVEAKTVPKQAGRYGRFVGIRIGCRVGYLYEDEFEMHVVAVIDAARLIGSMLTEPLVKMGYNESVAVLQFRTRLFHPNNIGRERQPGA